MVICYDSNRKLTQYSKAIMAQSNVFKISYTIHKNHVNLPEV